MKINKWLILIVLFLISSLVCCSCSGSNGSSYKSFSVKEGIAHFIFEYSDHYKIVYTYNKNDMSYVTLTGPFIKEAKDYSSIGITIYQPNYFAQNAQELLEGSIRINGNWPGFQQLELTDTTVSGIPAKLFAYQERNLQPVNRGLKEPPLEINREVTFDYNGLIWAIDLRSIPLTIDIDKSDFDHVLQTFKILD